MARRTGRNCTRSSSIRAIRGVSLQVRRGEIATVLGSNGAGKTTTLNAIAGLIPPSGGRIVFRDENIAGSLRARADEALYVAKRLGRNRVVMWAPGIRSNATPPWTDFAGLLPQP